MNDDDRTRLLYGPYRTPSLKVGERATCLYRDALVVVYDWSLARIPWPLCCRADTPRPCGWGLLVEEELARAICSEAAVAVSYWWGVSISTVVKWRAALDVDRINNPGTHRLVYEAVLKASASRDFSQTGKSRVVVTGPGGNGSHLSCSCCDQRSARGEGSCACSQGSCSNCHLCERHCLCGYRYDGYRYDGSSWDPLRFVLGLGMRTNMTYDAHPLPDVGEPLVVDGK